MPIYSQTNLYPGVNAHLNNALQVTPGESWETFHSDYITLLRIALDQILPPGYYAASEKSLQIGEYEAQTLAAARTRWTKSDVVVEKQTPIAPAASSSAPLLTSPAFTLPLPQPLELEDMLTSVTIMQRRSAAGSGQPITRIELLSPGNKPGRPHHEHYLVKRVELLRAGLRLVEIDFLHFFKPIRTALPSYRDQESGSSPYVMLISDPRPTFDEGVTAVYPFGVLDEIPALFIPLDQEDRVLVDFGAVYDDLIASSRLFQQLADYAQDPLALDRFMSTDRELLAQFLERLRKDRSC